MNKISDAKVESLINIATHARERAIAPYSGYKVGAALAAKSRATYDGMNVEMATYSGTTHAERRALNSALENGEREFVAITSRQIGKSTALAIFSIWCATFNKYPGTLSNNTSVGIASASDIQAKKLLYEMKKFLRLGDRHMELTYQDGGQPQFGSEFFTQLLDEHEPNNTTTITFKPYNEEIHGKHLLVDSKSGSTIKSYPATSTVLGETFSVVIIDEAYSEFSGVSIASLVPRYPNLITLRTFSKWAGLAGLRAGYGIFPKSIADFLMKIKQPYNVNTAAQVAVLESLRDIDYLQEIITKIVTERERLFSRLEKEIGWLKPYPSQGNFILCQVTNNKAPMIHQDLRKRGIFIRYFNIPELKNYLRISVGKSEDTDVLIDALCEIC